MFRNLKAYRVKANLTQEELANKIGITTRNYISKENGKSQFKLDEAKLIADLFGTTIDELFFKS